MRHKLHSLIILAQKVTLDEIKLSVCHTGRWWTEPLLLKQNKTGLMRNVVHKRCSYVTEADDSLGLTKSLCEVVQLSTNN